MTQIRHVSLRKRIGQLVRIRGRSRGQVVVMLAFAMVALIGMLGLATDLGYLFVERRTLQNAADAAALAGAQQLTKWDATNKKYTNSLSVLDSVQSVISGNEVGGKAPTIVSCNYVDSHANALGECDSSAAAIPPALASGVKVVVKETHSTFFIRIVGPKTASTSTTSTAQVYHATVIPNDAPFIVCGTQDPNGSQPAILNADDTINYSANGTTYLIHAQNGGKGLNQCSAKGGSFDGLASNKGGNDNATIPGDWTIKTGETSGPTREAVDGVAGCGATTVWNDCVLILPVANNASGNGSNTVLYVVNIAAFQVTQVAANQHTGTLLASYTIGSATYPIKATSTWTVGQDGVLLIRIVK